MMNQFGYLWLLRIKRLIGVVNIPQN